MKVLNFAVLSIAFTLAILGTPAHAQSSASKNPGANSPNNPELPATPAMDDPVKDAPPSNGPVAVTPPFDPPPGQLGNSAKPDRPDRPDRPEKPGLPQDQERPEKPDRPERPERPEKLTGREIADDLSTIRQTFQDLRLRWIEQWKQAVAAERERLRQELHQQREMQKSATREELRGRSIELRQELPHLRDVIDSAKEEIKENSRERARERRGRD